MLKALSVLALGTAIALPASASAELALGLKAGTPGAGLELTYGINDSLNARLGYNRFDYDYETTEDGIDYEGDLKLESFSALLDWHPMKGNFRVSVGAFSNGNEFDLTASGQDNVQIGNRTYDIDGQVDATVDFNDFAPYVGIGWGDAVAGSKHWSFGVDLGVLFQGSPEAQLTGSGQAFDETSGMFIDMTDDPTFQEELAREEQDLNDDMEDYKYYPVFAVGLNYRF